MTDLTTDFIRQNEWANLRLIDACRALTEEQMGATAVGTMGSVRQTWGHVISSELHYARLLGQDVAQWDDENEPWPGWDGLADLAQRAGDALVAAVEPADRRVRSGSGKWDIDAPVIIVQAVHHGTDHRSQINTILTTLGVEAPDVSSWSWAEETGRLHEV